MNCGQLPATCSRLASTCKLQQYHLHPYQLSILCWGVKIIIMDKFWNLEFLLMFNFHHSLEFLIIVLRWKSMGTFPWLGLISKPCSYFVSFSICLLRQFTETFVLLIGECADCWAQIWSIEGASLEDIDEEAACQLGAEWFELGPSLGCGSAEEWNDCQRCYSCCPGRDGFRRIFETGDVNCCHWIFVLQQCLTPEADPSGQAPRNHWLEFGVLLVGDILEISKRIMSYLWGKIALQHSCAYFQVFFPDLKMGGKRQWLRGSKVDGDLKKDLL